MESFGPYRLLERIASGGMGEIYKAKRLGAAGFEKVVALKMVLPEHARDAEFVQALIDEAKLASRLTHGNIAQILDLVQVGEDWAEVLEFVDGVDLFRLERTLEQHERRLGVDEAVHIAKEILVGLDYVHRASDDDGAPLGLVHCDVAPANVMINKGGEVKLLDFGTAVGHARSLGQRGPGGKIRYRSPEQVRGEEFDPRSDLYSVGVVLWELLAGERIYESMSLEAILGAVGEADVPPIGSVRPGLPDGLLRVLKRALQVDPRYRYPHAAAFLRALEDLPIGRDPARSRHVLAEIVGALRSDQDGSNQPLNAVTVAEDEAHSLEDVLDREL